MKPINRTSCGRSTPSSSWRPAASATSTPRAPRSWAVSGLAHLRDRRGLTLAVSTAAPATYDAAGYGALTYTTVGELTDLGSGLGRQYNTVTHSPIATSQVIEKKASYKLGSIDMMCAWDMSDAGQDILRTAADSQTQILSIKITKQSGDIRYFTAQVAKFVENFGTVDNREPGRLHAAAAEGRREQPGLIAGSGDAAPRAPPANSRRRFSLEALDGSALDLLRCAGRGRGARRGAPWIARCSAAPRSPACSWKSTTCR
jgi:hypothetical protein